MTRKKSNVKALALAVTCAILAGGYSGLNPVYAAADTLYKEGTNVTTSSSPSTGSGTNQAIDQLTVGGVTIGNFGTSGGTGRIEAANVKISNNLTVDKNLKIGNDITISGSDGKLTVNAVKINGNNTVTGILRVGEIRGLDVIDPSTPAVSGQADLKINGATFASGGVITATSLKLTGTNAVEDVGAAVNENTTNIANNKTNLLYLNGEVDTLKATVGDDNNGLVKDVKALGDKTQKISYDASSNTTTVNGIKFHTDNDSGISDINDGIIKFSKNGSKDIVQINSDLIFNDNDAGQAATLTLEGVKTLNGLSNGSSKIEAGNGSVVGGVKFDNKKITDVDSVMVNKDANNQVQINSEGIVVGLHSTVIGSDGVYAGGHTEATAKAVLGADGSIKGAGDGAGKYNFTVDSSNGTVTINDVGNVATISGGGISIADASGSDYLTMGKGTVLASASVISPKFFVDPNNAFEKNSLKVGDGTKGVTIADGEITTTGDATVGGNLSVAGTSTFTGKTTFSGGINTDTIDEANPNAGVTVDGVLLKDKGIDAADGKFKVDGATGDTTVGGKLDVTGNITGADITASGALKGGSLNVTNDATVGGKLDVTGAATVGGTLGVKGDISTDGSVTAKGGLSAANDKFKVDGATGNTAIDGTLKSKGNFSVGDNDEFTVDASNGNVVSKGSLTSSSATIGTVGITNTGVITGVSSLTTDALIVKGALNINGDITGKKISGDSLEITGNGTIGGSLGVTGAITGATINGATITTDSFNDAKISNNKFNGVTLDTNGDISGKDINAAGKINGATITDNSFNGVTLSNGNVTGGTITGTTVTDGAGASMNAGTVKGTTITDGNGFTATGGNVSAKNVTATGAVQGTTVTDGVAKMTGGKVTAQNGVEVDANNYLNSSGLKTSNIDASKATIGKINIEGSKITSTEADGTVGIAGITVNNAGALNNVTSIDGVSVGAVTGGNGLEFGGNAVIGATGKPFSSTGFEVDGAGNVTGKSFKVNASNYLDSTGLTAEAATIGGVNKLDNTGIDTSGKLHVGGQATFGDSTSGNYTTVNGGKVEITANGGKTTIEGAKITTKTLDVEDIILRNEMKDGTGATINIKGSDGSLSVASGAFAVDKDGQLTNKISGNAGGYSYETKLETSKSGIKANYTNTINGNQNTIAMGANGISIGVAGTTPSVGAGFKAELDAATMGYGTANSIVVNKDTIKSALGTDVTRVMTNNTTEQSIVDKVGTAKRSLKADEIVDEVAGMTVKTNSDGTLFTNGTTNTIINGSAITSTNGSATGVLDGSNLTLTNGANSTALTAGGATFNGAAGEKGGTQTIINGGTISTDTLNVERINLGGEVIDKGAAGVEANSKLYMDAQGNFRAAGGNFKVNGADGAMTNTVGNTTLTTDTTGASMNYAGTANSNISVADGKAEMAVGTNAAVTATDGKVEIKGGTQNVTTTDAGTVFENSAHNTPFVTGGAANTVINGNEITTGKLTTDQLVITGSGAAGGAGSIAFGGDGSITSNIKDAATGKEATFKTNAEGTFTEAKDGANVTTNTVNAQGNTNKVTDGTNTSTATQTATSIGGVVTNGTVTMKQELTADGLKLEQTGYDEVNIAKGDVTVKNNRNTANPNQEVHLSDLGSLNNLDSELTARDEYKDNKTAVGAINAEAGIRREEVARLDNRIDDVNNRVDKVGAMAAAIASLKSIGYDPQAPSEFSIGLGQYKGETGVAMGFFHYPNKNFMINVSLSTAGGETMGGIGATWRFGHKSPQKLLDEQREAQAKKELAAAEKYQAAAKLAKEAQERAEYAAKLARQAQVSADNAKAAADATQAKHFQ